MRFFSTANGMDVQTNKTNEVGGDGEVTDVPATVAEADAQAAEVCGSNDSTNNGTIMKLFLQNGDEVVTLDVTFASPPTGASSRNAKSQIIVVGVMLSPITICSTILSTHMKPMLSLEIEQNMKNMMTTDVDGLAITVFDTLVSIPNTSKNNVYCALVDIGTCPILSAATFHAATTQNYIHSIVHAFLFF